SNYQVYLEELLIATSPESEISMVDLQKAYSSLDNAIQQELQCGQDLGHPSGTVECGDSAVVPFPMDTASCHRPADRPYTAADGGSGKTQENSDLN
ncbi:hypothetical protein GW7_12956, partial [Heterocephalus glaber]